MTDPGLTTEEKPDTSREAVIRHLSRISYYTSNEDLILALVAERDALQRRLQQIRKAQRELQKTVKRVEALPDPYGFGRDEIREAARFLHALIRLGDPNADD